MNDEQLRPFTATAAQASFMGNATAHAAKEERTAANFQAQIVRELRDHTDRGVIDGWASCKCGWFVRAHSADAHRRHIAERLATAGLVKRP